MMTGIIMLKSDADAPKFQHNRIQKAMLLDGWRR
jgi:hypothetical protein